MSSSTSSVRTSWCQAERRALEVLVDQVLSANTLDELAQQHSLPPPPTAIPSDDSATVKSSKDTTDVSESESNDSNDGSETPAKTRSSQNKKVPLNNYPQNALFNKWQGGKVALNDVTNELKEVEKRSEKELSNKERELTQTEKKLTTVAKQLDSAKER